MSTRNKEQGRAYDRKWAAQNADYRRIYRRVYRRLRRAKTEAGRQMYRYELDVLICARREGMLGELLANDGEE